MDCKDIDNLLTAYLEGEVTPEEELSQLSFACCDCALVHELRVIRDGDKIFISFTRNQRKTGAMRRHHGVPAIAHLKSYEE